MVEMRVGGSQFPGGLSYSSDNSVAQHGRCNSRHLFGYINGDIPQSSDSQPFRLPGIVQDKIEGPII